MTDLARPGVALAAFWLEELLAGVGRYPDTWRTVAGGDYLITGGGGLLGSQAAGMLAVLRERRTDIGEIYLLDTLGPGASMLVDYLVQRYGVRLIEADVTRPLSRVPRAQNIIHGASIPSPSWFRRQPITTVLVNTVGTINVLDYAEKSGARRVMHISSSGIYGNLPTAAPWREDMTGSVDLHDPRACYDESKRVAETVCAEACRERGIPVTVIRPFNAYGPGQRRDDGRIVPHLIEEALRGGPLRLETDGSPRRCFCYALDVTGAMLLCMGSAAPWEVFNVGSAEEVSMAGLARLVSESFGLDKSCVRLGALPPRGGGSGPAGRAPSIAAISDKYGWQPAISLREGIRRTARYHELLRACQC